MVVVAVEVVVVEDEDDYNDNDDHDHDYMILFLPLHLCSFQGFFVIQCPFCLEQTSLFSFQHHVQVYPSLPRETQIWSLFFHLRTWVI